MLRISICRLKWKDASIDFCRALGCIEIVHFPRVFGTAQKINACPETINHCAPDRFQSLLDGEALKADLSGQALEATRNMPFNTEEA